MILCKKPAKKKEGMDRWLHLYRFFFVLSFIKQGQNILSMDSVIVTHLKRIVFAKDRHHELFSLARSTCRKLVAQNAGSDDKKVTEASRWHPISTPPSKAASTSLQLDRQSQTSIASTHNKDTNPCTASKVMNRKMDSENFHSCLNWKSAGCFYLKNVLIVHYISQ